MPREGEPDAKGDTEEVVGGEVQKSSSELHSSRTEDAGSYRRVAIEDLEQGDEGQNIGDESDDL